MPPEYLGDGRFERSHKEAAGQLIKDACRYIPRLYVRSLIENPGLTAGATSLLLGGGLFLAGQKDMAMLVGLGIVIFPTVGALANTVQVGANIWNLYRKEWDCEEIAGVTLRRIFKIRNFF